MKKILSLRNLFLSVAVLALGYYIIRPDIGSDIFKGISGPNDVSVVAPAVEARWQTYSGGSSSRLAILLTDEKSNWVGLAHGLKSIGLPFSITTDYHEAVQHKVVLVYPIISGAVLKADALEALRSVPRKGGTLIGFEVLGGGIEDVFGFTGSVPGKIHPKLKFTSPPPNADPLEVEIPIDNPEAGDDAFGAYAYTHAVDPPLAVYEDGTAAILKHKTKEGGLAVAFGFDLGALLLKGYDNREENMARSYDNGYEPALDVLLRLLEDFYRKGNDQAVTLNPVPFGKDLAVVLTHDIDYSSSLRNSIAYAKMERAEGVKATYFIQTKYLKDYNDELILTTDSPDCLKSLHDMGMELASHTVCHSREFRHFPLGTGAERFPEYHPFVEDRAVTTGASILGELRVSRFLIEQLTKDVHVVSFRPGYLSNPYSLPEALAATGYAFSSSVTANDSLTHLPFQLTFARENTSEVPIFEFPVTVEDEAPLLSSRLPEGPSVAKKIARHGGLCVVLIHPNVIEPKLSFEKQFITGVKDFSWFGTMEEFGNWWVARNEANVDSSWKNGTLDVHIKVPHPIQGLTLELPDGVHLNRGQKDIKEITASKVVVNAIESDVDLFFTH